MSRASRVRVALPLVLLVAAIVVVALLAGPPAESGPPLDPDSTGPDGTRALVDTLLRLGAHVTLDGAVPEPGADVALLLTDNLTDELREELLVWVGGGGVLVVADPFSSLTPEVAGPATLGGFDLVPIRRGNCPLEALAAVDAVSPGQPSQMYDATPASVGCFDRNDGHWLVAHNEGEGVIVALGGPEVLVNVRLADSDHPQLAAALLAPRPGTNLAFLRPPRPGEGEATLGELLPDRVRWFLLQLAAAFVVFAWWRARRLGPVVEERQPVRLPGSELVTAVGGLLQQTRALGRAAELLRGDLRRTLSARLGLPHDTTDKGVADAVAARTGADHVNTLGVLSASIPGDEAALVRLARDTERLRREVLSPQTNDRAAPSKQEPQK